MQLLLRNTKDIFFIIYIRVSENIFKHPAFIDFYTLEFLRDNLLQTYF